MSEAIYNHCPSFPSGEAFAQFSVLNLDPTTGKLLKSADDEAGEYIANREAFAADETISVTPTNHNGIIRAVAAGAIANHAVVRVAAGGTVDDAGTGRILGRAFGAVTAAGDVVYIRTVPTV